MLQNTDYNFLTNVLQREQMNGFPDNLDFEKIKTRDRFSNNTGDPLNFRENCASTCPTQLAHATAAQSHDDTKAMARAKSSSQKD